jgi:hypothetical protein
LTVFPFFFLSSDQVSGEPPWLAPSSSFPGHPGPVRCHPEGPTRGRTASRAHGLAPQRRRPASHASRASYVGVAAANRLASQDSSRCCPWARGRLPATLPHAAGCPASYPQAPLRAAAAHSCMDITSRWRRRP